MPKKLIQLGALRDNLQTYQTYNILSALNRDEQNLQVRDQSRWQAETDLKTLSEIAQSPEVLDLVVQLRQDLATYLDATSSPGVFPDRSQTSENSEVLAWWDSLFQRANTIRDLLVDESRILRVTADRLPRILYGVSLFTVIVSIILAILVLNAIRIRVVSGLTLLLDRINAISRGQKPEPSVGYRP